MEGAAVAGIGMVRFGMLNDYPVMHLARDAGLLALHDAGMTLADVDEVFIGYIQPRAMIGVKAVKELGLTGLPVTHVENASATGLVAYREAAWAVCVGAVRRRHGAVLRQVHRHGERRRSGSGTRHRSTHRSSRRPTSPCGRSAGCTSGGPRSRTSPPSRPRTGTTARCVPRRTASPTTW